PNDPDVDATCTPARPKTRPTGFSVPGWLARRRSHHTHGHADDHDDEHADRIVPEIGNPARARMERKDENSAQPGKQPDERAGAVRLLASTRGPEDDHQE